MIRNLTIYLVKLNYFRLAGNGIVLSAMNAECKKYPPLSILQSVADENIIFYRNSTYNTYIHRHTPTRNNVISAFHSILSYIFIAHHHHHHHFLRNHYYHHYVSVLSVSLHLHFTKYIVVRRLYSFQYIENVKKKKKRGEECL